MAWLKLHYRPCHKRDWFRERENDQLLPPWPQHLVMLHTLHVKVCFKNFTKTQAGYPDDTSFALPSCDGGREGGSEWVKQRWILTSGKRLVGLSPRMWQNRVVFRLFPNGVVTQDGDGSLFARTHAEDVTKQSCVCLFTKGVSMLLHKTGTRSVFARILRMWHNRTVGVFTRDGDGTLYARMSVCTNRLWHSTRVMYLLLLYMYSLICVYVRILRTFNYID
jgi:hypothetical protein